MNNLPNYKRAYRKDVDLIQEYYLKYFKTDPEIIFDIGAHVGGITIPLSNTFNTAIIHAFEPITETFQILHSKTKTHKNIRIHNFGFNDENKDDVEFYMPAGKRPNMGRMSIYETNGKERTEKGNLKCLDAWVNRYNLYPQLVKIDAEGCEYNMLKNADKFLDGINLLHIELNKIFETTNELKKMLDDKYTRVFNDEKQLNYIYINNKGAK